MNATERQAHWENVYSSKGETDVSWFQQSPEPSLELLERAGGDPGSAIIDIGGGASRLVDALLARGYVDVTVLDLSAAALSVAARRIGETARRAHWLAADATTWTPERPFDIWHDRAAFHFLTDAIDQAAYIEHLRQAVRVGGHVIIGAFAPDGPEKCSGLPVARHDAASLQRLLGPNFLLIDARRHEHETPNGSLQRFQFSTFRRVG